MSAMGADRAHAAPGDVTEPNTYIPIAEKATPSGVATLDADGKILIAQLPDLSPTFDTQIAPLRPLARTRKSPGLLPIFKNATVAAQPLAVGVDGYVYATATDSSNRLLRSKDGFQTREVGVKFSDLGNPGAIVYAARHAEGFVAMLSTGTSTGKTGSLWYSPESFINGWTKITDTQSLIGLSISRPVPTKAGTVQLVGDYVSGLVNPTCRLRLTRDGGKTYTVIRTKTQVSTAYNNHWHGCGYDPSTGPNGRIWASGGDGENNIWEYSDDWGASWTAVPHTGGAGPDEPGASIYNHPTMVITGPQDKMFVTPDGSASLAEYGHQTREPESWRWRMSSRPSPAMGSTGVGPMRRAQTWIRFI